MSLWFPMMLNERKIGEVVITRQEELRSPHDEHEYTYEVTYSPIGEDGWPTGKLITKGGTVTHYYDNGWPALVENVLYDMIEPGEG